MSSLYEIGHLKIGDPCVVILPGRANWLCRVVDVLPMDERLNSVYECMTPWGSKVVAGAVWVRSPLEDELRTLLETEQLVLARKRRPYLGKLAHG